MREKLLFNPIPINHIRGLIRDLSRDSWCTRKVVLLFRLFVNYFNNFIMVVTETFLYLP